MRVHPEFQRRGFGEAILEHLESRAIALGYTMSRLETTVHQVPAQNLYAKYGYSEIGRSEVSGFEAITYEKSLQTE